jgi:hypothetical protein
MSARLSSTCARSRKWESLAENCERRNGKRRIYRGGGRKLYGETDGMSDVCENGVDAFLVLATCGTPLLHRHRLMHRSRHVNYNVLFIRKSRIEGRALFRGVIEWSHRVLSPLLLSIHRFLLRQHDSSGW